MGCHPQQLKSGRYQVHHKYIPLAEQNPMSRKKADVTTFRPPLFNPFPPLSRNKSRASPNPAFTSRPQPHQSINQNQSGSPQPTSPTQISLTPYPSLSPLTSQRSALINAIHALHASRSVSNTHYRTYHGHAEHTSIYSISSSLHDLPCTYLFK